MKNRVFNKSFFVLSLFLLVSFAANAQESLRTGYFLKGNLYRHTINPALMNNRNYVSLPILGGMNLDTGGDVGIDNFVFDNPNGGDKVSFMHESVDANDFLGGLENENKIMANIDMVIMSAGFFGFGGYNTIDLGFHSHTGMNVPYELFNFMKTADPAKANSYSINDVNVLTRNYFDVALGHSS